MQKTASTSVLPKVSIDISKKTKLFALTNKINNMDLHCKPLSSIGSMMGSGGIIVMDEGSCMVDTAKHYMDFITKESCGKCASCRIGSKRILELLTDISEGKGSPEHLGTLKNLGEVMRDTALCGFGQTAPNPVLSNMHFFMDEYKAHILEKRCPAKVCAISEDL